MSVNGRGGRGAMTCSSTTPGSSAISQTAVSTTPSTSTSTGLPPHHLWSPAAAAMGRLPPLQVYPPPPTGTAMMPPPSPGDFSGMISPVDRTGFRQPAVPPTPSHLQDSRDLLLRQAGLMPSLYQPHRISHLDLWRHYLPAADVLPRLPTSSLPFSTTGRLPPPFGLTSSSGSPGHYPPSTDARHHPYARPDVSRTTSGRSPASRHGSSQLESLVARPRSVGVRPTSPPYYARPEVTATVTTAAVTPATVVGPASWEQSSGTVYPMHFMQGSMIQLENGQLKRVEDLRTDDFTMSADLSNDLKIDSSQVVQIDERRDNGTAILSFIVGEQKLRVTVEAALEHPFFVFGQGWSSCSPERSLNRYHLSCHKLVVGDICISLTRRHGNQERSECTATVKGEGGEEEARSRNGDSSRETPQYEAVSPGGGDIDVVDTDPDPTDTVPPLVSACSEGSGSADSSLTAPPTSTSEKAIHTDHATPCQQQNHGNLDTK